MSTLEIYRDRTVLGGIKHKGFYAKIYRQPGTGAYIAICDELLDKKIETPIIAEGKTMQECRKNFLGIIDSKGLYKETAKRTCEMPRKHCFQSKQPATEDDFIHALELCRSRTVLGGIKHESCYAKIYRQPGTGIYAATCDELLGEKLKTPIIAEGKTMQECRENFFKAIKAKSLEKKIVERIREMRV